MDMVNLDDEDMSQEGHVELKEGIDLNSVLTGQVFEINFDKIQNNYENEKLDLKDDEIAAFAKMNLEMDSDEDETDINSTPFEKLAIKMVNVTKDGKIKKRIKRAGTGNTPPENSLVAILYSSYLEYSDEPTDYAFIKKPFQFRLGSAGIIGLNFAVESMQVNEKSHFLIHPDYAFGSMGHPPRIPANATFFFQIELLRYSDSGSALQFNKLTDEEKKQFPSAHKTALGLIESAKETFKHGNMKLTIREYNRALGLIDQCNLRDMSEQEEQQKLKLKLLTNLALCYNRDTQPKKACSMCNDIFNLVKNTSLPIPAKVYFHNGRALAMLGEYKKAIEKLLKAQKMEPLNYLVSLEIIKVNSEIEKQREKERKFAKLCMQSTDKAIVEDKEKDNESFRKKVADLCEDLRNKEDTQFSLPSGLTVKEYVAAKEEAEKVGLKFRESKHNENDGKLIFYITKM